MKEKDFEHIDYTHAPFSGVVAGLYLEFDGGVDALCEVVECTSDEMLTCLKGEGLGLKPHHLIKLVDVGHGIFGSDFTEDQIHEEFEMVYLNQFLLEHHDMLSSVKWRALVSVNRDDQAFVNSIVNGVSAGMVKHVTVGEGVTVSLMACSVDEAGPVFRVSRLVAHPLMCEIFYVGCSFDDANKVYESVCNPGDRSLYLEQDDVIDVRARAFLGDVSVTHYTITCCKTGNVWHKIQHKVLDRSEVIYFGDCLVEAERRFRSTFSD